MLEWFDSRADELETVRHPRWAARGGLAGEAAQDSFVEWREGVEAYASFLDKLRQCPFEQARLARKRQIEEGHSVPTVSPKAERGGSVRPFFKRQR